MKPFLLNLKCDAQQLDTPTLHFDEALSLSVVSDTGLPLADSIHLVATATKTEAAPERDDEDVDYFIDMVDDESVVMSQRSVLATLTKTAAEKESDDSD